MKKKLAVIERNRTDGHMLVHAIFNMSEAEGAASLANEVDAPQAEYIRNTPGGVAASDVFIEAVLVNTRGGVKFLRK